MTEDWKLVDVKPFQEEEETKIFIYRHDNHQKLRLVIVEKNEIAAYVRLSKLVKEGKMG